MGIELDGITSDWVLSLNRAVLFGTLIFLFARNKDVPGLADWVIFTALLFINSVIKLFVGHADLIVDYSNEFFQIVLSGICISFSYIFLARGFQKFSEGATILQFKPTMLLILSSLFALYYFEQIPQYVFVTVVYVIIVGFLCLTLYFIQRLNKVLYFQERRLALIATGILAIFYAVFAIRSGFRIPFDPPYIGVWLSIFLSLSVTVVTVSLIPLVVANRGRRLYAELRERKKLEASLSRALEQANMAENARSLFLKNVSHEMRTPLNAIIGFSDVLQSEAWGGLNDKQKEHVKYISSSGNLLLRVVEDLLSLVNFDKNQTVKMIIRPCAFKYILEETLPLIQKMTQEKNITLELPDTNNLPPIMADKLRLTQIMTNLISNATKYGNRGGYVRITCEIVGNTFLKISVIDNGHGIAPDERQKIFEPFYRSDKEDPGIEGMGIGLSLMLAYVTEMKGEVGVDSERGKGSTFWFTIPLARNEA